jgi:hypothetical protein
MSKKPILCVDFDGVIHSYSSGWQGATIIPDPPVPGALRWLLRASEWWDVQVYSSRTKEPGGVQAMRDWLRVHSIEEWGDSDERERLLHSVSFPEQKPAAVLSIDDRAICFDGVWETLDPQALLGFRPWNRIGG